MKVILNQSAVDVNCYLVKANLRQSQKRPDLQYICEIIASAKGDSSLNDVFRSQLKINDSQIKVLRNHLKSLELLSEGDRLTDLGRDVSQNGLVHIPEEGSYLIWSPSKELNNIHFLFKKNSIIHWQPYNKLSSLSKKIHYNIDTEEMKSVIENKTSTYWKISSLSEENNYRGNLDLDWIWNLAIKQNTIIENLKIKGKITHPIKFEKNKLITKTEEFNENYSPNNMNNMQSAIDILHGWVSDIHNWQWDNGFMAFKVPFEKRTDSEIQSFQSYFEKKVISFGEQKFELSVLDIPIVPIDNNNAKKWAERLFELKLESENLFLLPGEYREAMESIRVSTPLGQYDYKDDIEAFKKHIRRKNTRHYWNLVAADDMTSILSEKETDERNTIGYGEKLNYKRAFDRLFKDANLEATTKILYMDRHALEYRNTERILEMLDIMKSQGFSGKFYLISIDMGQEINPELSKRASIMTINQIYGSNSKPHSRYIIFKESRKLHFYELTHNLTHPKKIDGNLYSWGDIVSIKHEPRMIENDITRGKLLELVRNE